MCDGEGLGEGEGPSTRVARGGPLGKEPSEPRPEGGEGHSHAEASATLQTGGWTDDVGLTVKFEFHSYILSCE